MSKKAEVSGIREAVGVFMGADDLKRAGEALLAAGFDRTALGLLASKEAVESSLGDLYARANALPSSFRSCSVNFPSQWRIRNARPVSFRRRTAEPDLRCIALSRPR